MLKKLKIKREKAVNNIYFEIDNDNNEKFHVNPSQFEEETLNDVRE